MIFAIQEFLDRVCFFLPIWIRSHWRGSWGRDYSYERQCLREITCSKHLPFWGPRLAVLARPFLSPLLGCPPVTEVLPLFPISCHHLGWSPSPCGRAVPQPALSVAGCPIFQLSFTPLHSSASLPKTYSASGTALKSIQAQPCLLDSWSIPTPQLHSLPRTSHSFLIQLKSPGIMISPALTNNPNLVLWAHHLAKNQPSRNQIVHFLWTYTPTQMCNAKWKSHNQVDWIHPNSPK